MSMKTRMMFVALSAIICIITTGCGGVSGPQWTTKPFMLAGDEAPGDGIFDIHVDAIETMNKMERMQTRVNGGRPVQEVYVFGLYADAAGGKGKTKITKKKALKALKEYQKRLLIRAAALPPLMPDANSPQLMPDANSPQLMPDANSQPTVPLPD